MVCSLLFSTAIALGANSVDAGDAAKALYQLHVVPEQQEQRKATFEELAGTKSLEAHVPYLNPIRRKSFTEPVEAIAELGNLDWPHIGRNLLLTEAGLTLSGESEYSGLSLSDPVALLKGLSRERDLAIAALTDEEKDYAFSRVPETVASFWPQFNYNDAGKAIIEKDQKLFQIAQKIGWERMKDIAFFISFVNARDARAAADKIRNKTTVPGVYGPLVGAVNTAQGWIIVGDEGLNYYEPTEPVAMIIDLGGNDTYKGGSIGCVSRHHGVSFIYDLKGNDVYDLDPFLLACGRLGVSIVRDEQGDDRYMAKVGGGGTGFAGIGFLLDLTGNDTYTGERFSLGAAMGGAGVILDEEGDDRYEADLFAMGVGGPLGAGALVDVDGDDHMRLGFKHASGYNGSDAPDGDPNNPNFQYEAWGLGMGIGRRVWPIPAWAEVAPYLAAGGVGIVLNHSGDDVYESSNFSLGSGYFFGTGAFQDKAGDDIYRAARYGLGSGAHYAMGFFGEGAGNDRYESTGPTYNCGCSWDRSIFQFVDFAGDDVYDLRRSAGPGRGDIGSWGLAMDAAGSDRYLLNSLPGSTSRNGLGSFFDLAGSDVYEGAAEAGDGKSAKSGEAGLFKDLP